MTKPQRRTSRSLANGLNRAINTPDQRRAAAPSIIHHRTDFAASMIDGRTVMELPRAQRSTSEIEILWEYLENRLARANPAPPIAAPPIAIEDEQLRAVGGILR